MSSLPSPAGCLSLPEGLAGSPRCELGPELGAKTTPLAPAPPPTRTHATPKGDADLLAEGFSPEQIAALATRAVRA